MREDKRQRIWPRSLDMNKMNIEPIDCHRKLRKLIQLLFLRPPIKFINPIVRERLQEREVCSIIPFRVGDLIRKPRFKRRALRSAEIGSLMRARNGLRFPIRITKSLNACALRNTLGRNEVSAVVLRMGA
jgi:hypothetical protein